MSRRRQRPCPTAGKTAFPSEAIAEEALEEIRMIYASSRAAPREKIPRSSYHCPCGKWHLTSREHSRDQAAAEGAQRITTASVGIAAVMAASRRA